MMQQTLRPYATTGIAIAGAALVAVTPVTPLPTQLRDSQPRLPYEQPRDVALTATNIFEPYLELFTNTAANLQSLGSQALDFPILTQILADPAGSLANLPQVFELLTSLQPVISTVDGQTIVDLPPLLILAIAQLGPLVNLIQAFNQIVAQVFDFNDPGGAFAALFGAPATLLNALLNGEGDFGLLGLNFPLFNGLLVPGHAADLQSNVGDLVNALGLGNETPNDLLDQLGIGQLQVADLATGLLGALGLGDQTPIDLLDKIGLGDQSVAGLASLLLNAFGVGNPTVTDLLGQIGLADQPVADLAKALLDALGIGNPTIPDLSDQVGLSDQSVAGLVNHVLDALQIGDPTINELLGQLDVADLTVGGLLTTAIDALGLGGQTPITLLDAMGGGDLTLNGVATSLLSSLGIGDQNLIALLDQAGVADVNLGDVIVGMLGDTADKTVADLLVASGFGGVTVEDITDILGLTDFSLGALLQNLGDLGYFPQNLGVNDLIIATGGSPITKADPGSLVDSFSGFTIGQILNDQGLLHQTLLEVLSTPDADGMSMGDQTLAEFIHANVPASLTLGSVLTDAGYGGQTLNELLASMLPDQTLAQMLTDAGLNVPLTSLFDQFGLNDMTIASMLSDSGLGDQHLQELIDQMFGTATIGSLLDGSDLAHMDLDTLIDQLLGTATVGSMLDDSGLGGLHLDELLDQFFGTTTLSSLLSDSGLGDVDLNTLVGQLFGDATVSSLLGDLGTQTLNSILADLGLADTEVINAQIGEFFGSLPYLMHGLSEQIAAVLAG